MSEKIRPLPGQEMHKYVLGLVGVFTLFAVTFPIACWRVSQHKKFADVRFHVKSLTMDGKLPASSQSVAIEPAADADQMFQLLALSNTSYFSPLLNFSAASEVNNQIFPSLEIAETNQTIAVAEITDPVQLRNLNQKVYDQIASDRQPLRKFEQDLVYRVGVTASGAIASLKPINQAASDSLPQTPLANLLKSSVSDIAQESLVEFRIVFTRQGILEVSPWHGFKRRSVY